VKSYFKAVGDQSYARFAGAGEKSFADFILRRATELSTTRSLSAKKLVWNEVCTLGYEPAAAISYRAVEVIKLMEKYSADCK
jgi:S-adenosylmethionine synthetase